MAYDEVGRKASGKYRSKFDMLQIRIPQGDRNKINDHAKERGESMNAFINRAIKETMERDKNSSDNNNA